MNSFKPPTEEVLKILMHSIGADEKLRKTFGRPKILNDRTDYSPTHPALLEHIKNPNIHK
jgi:hypothetical protein